MTIHKLLIDDFVTVDYKLIAIHASLEDYRLAYFINKTLGVLQEKSLKYSISRRQIRRCLWPERSDKRIMEKVAAAAMRLINPLLLGKVAKYKSIKAENIAKAMLWLANHVYPETVVQSDEITKLAALYRP